MSAYSALSCCRNRQCSTSHSPKPLSHSANCDLAITIMSQYEWRFCRHDPLGRHFALQNRTDTEDPAHFFEICAQTPLVLQKQIRHICAKQSTFLKIWEQ